MNDNWMYCPKCEYEIRGATRDRCLLCNEPLVPYPRQDPADKKPGFQKAPVKDVKHSMDKTENAAAGGKAPEATPVDKIDAGEAPDASDERSSRKASRVVIVVSIAAAVVVILAIGMRIYNNSKPGILPEVVQHAPKERANINNQSDLDERLGNLLESEERIKETKGDPVKKTDLVKGALPASSKGADPPKVKVDGEPGPGTAAEKESVLEEALPSAPTTAPAERVPEPLPDNVSKNFYTIQVRTFSHKPNAEAVLKELKAKGYPVYVTQTQSRKNTVLYKVRFGRYQTQAEAEEAALDYSNRENKEFIIVLTSDSHSPAASAGAPVAPPAREGSDTGDNVH